MSQGVILYSRHEDSLHLLEKMNQNNASCLTLLLSLIKCHFINASASIIHFSSTLPPSLCFLTSLQSNNSFHWYTCLWAVLVNFMWKSFSSKTGWKMEQTLRRKVLLSWLILIFCKYFGLVNIQFQQWCFPLRGQTQGVLIHWNQLSNHRKRCLI